MINQTAGMRRRHHQRYITTPPTFPIYHKPIVVPSYNYNYPVIISEPIVKYTEQQVTPTEGWCNATKGCITIQNKVNSFCGIYNNVNYVCNNNLVCIKNQCEINNN